MLALLSAVLIASLLGSTHCAGMCGAFVAFAVGTGNASTNKRPPSRFALNTAYNLGRLTTYITLGAIAGALGAAFDLGGSLIGIQRTAAYIAGAVMVLFGLRALLAHFGVQLRRVPLPATLVNLARAGHARAFDLPPIARAATVGLLTTLLPCGWLYAFVIVSTGTASPLTGAASMAAFWLGTLPMMAAIGIGVQSIAGRLRRHLPLVTSLILVATGLWTLAGRLIVPSNMTLPVPVGIDQARNAVPSGADAAAHCPLCHTHD
jgi:sulfite exporter TauE/SafE